MHADEKMYCVGSQSNEWSEETANYKEAGSISVQRNTLNGVKDVVAFLNTACARLFSFFGSRFLSSIVRIAWIAHDVVVHGTSNVKCSNIWFCWDCACFFSSSSFSLVKFSWHCCCCRHWISNYSGRFHSLLYFGFVITCSVNIRLHLVSVSATQCDNIDVWIALILSYIQWIVAIRKRCEWCCLPSYLPIFLIEILLLRRNSTSPNPKLNISTSLLVFHFIRSLSSALARPTLLVFVSLPSPSLRSTTEFELLANSQHINFY